MPSVTSSGRSVAGLVLAPGAGTGSDHPGLVAIAEAVARSGCAVERVDFPYRLAGRRAPDPARVLVATIADAASRLADRLGVPTGAIALGGRSLGARMASLAVADGLAAAALVLVSYPLHPPGRPERSRTGHFGRLELPCLFVSGSRDAFGSPAELEAAIGAIPGEVAHVVVDGGDHGLRGHEDQVASAVAAWLAPLVARGSSAP